MIRTNKEFYKAAYANLGMFGAKRCGIQTTYNHLGANYWAFYYEDDGGVIVSGGGDSPEAAIRSAEHNFEKKKMDAEMKKIPANDEIML